MEKKQAGSRGYLRNSERTQDDRTVKWLAVDGKLPLDLDKRAFILPILNLHSYANYLNRVVWKKY